MEKKKRVPEKKRADIYYQFYDMKSVESAGELTGLVPSAPENGYDLAAYAELEGTPVPTDTSTDDGD